MKILSFILFIFVISHISVHAGIPDINCGDLPWCSDGGSLTGSNPAPINFVASIITEAIKYVAVIAVIALMVSGILYLISGGDEEKVKKAKMWITWALVGTLLSISSWYIINLINNLNIN